MRSWRRVAAQDRARLTNERERGSRLGSLEGGLLLLIGAVAGFVVVPEHRPPLATDTCAGFGGGRCPGVWRLSPTAYDALRITTWALLIAGVVVVIVGLINYARR